MAEETFGGQAPEGTSRRRRRALVLVAGLVGIVLWQYVFFRHAYPETTLESSYKFEASSGVLLWQPEFVYFLYYLNLYPVATIADGPLEYSVEGARRLIATQGHTLVMDRYWTIRYGDLAKTYLYLPHVWLKGRPVKPRMTHANALAFTLALVSLFAAFWSAQRTLLGTLLVVLIGSDPFQVHQVYANNNLFGWPISIAVLVLALHIPLMRERPRAATAVAIALVSGLILGSVRQIRTEPTLVLLSAAGIYLTANRLRLWLRFALVLILAGAFSWTAGAWTRYFEGKYREAYQVVKAAGGHTYEGPRHAYHFFWHAVWCGLGDFDDKYGYQWSDLSSFRYAWPVMQRRGVKMDGFEPPRPDPWDSLTLGVYWDRAGQYARTPQELREYIEVVRDKVLYDVLHDPAWYASIVGRRIVRFLLSGTAPSLALGNGWSVSIAGPVPWTLLALLLGVWLAVRRDWFHVKLLAFTLPLAATAIAVYSGGGTVYYSIVHLVAVAIVGAAAWRRVRSGPLELPRSLADRLRLPALRWRGWRAGVTAALVLLLAVTGLGVPWLMGLAGRAVAAAPAARPGEPRVAVMRFDNQTRSDELAWVGDAVGERFAAGLAASGVPLLDPEAVAWLDADLVVWTPSAILNGSLARAVNVVADRAGVAQVVAGRVLRDAGGPRACVTVFAPQGRAATSAEHCERVDIGHPYEAADRLAAVVRPVLGGGARRSASTDVSGNAVRRYAQGRESIQRQMWGKAARQLERAWREDPRLVAARRLGARVSSRWQPLAPEVLRAMTGADRPAGALEALRSEVARDPTSVEARIDLGRLLIKLELFDEAVTVLNPIRHQAGAPAEAFGLLAMALSSRGEMSRGYQVLLECRRRSWQEPTGNSLLGEHLTRWGYFELAMTYFDSAKGERPGQGMAPLIVDELLARWSMHALQRDWVECQKLATTLTTLDDPRAKGLGNSRLALGYLAAGRSRLAGVLAEDAAHELAEGGVDTGEALATAVQVRLEANDAAGALRFIAALRPKAVGEWRERLAFWEAIALAHLGRWPEAEAVRGRLARDLSDLPGPTGTRLLSHLDGEFALLRGDSTGAVASLSKAVGLLPARGFCGDHVPLWYALGQAERAAGRQDLARSWLERVTTASNERLCWPIPYARSYLLLGRILASSGRPGQAADAYRRFLDLWGEADFAAAERLEAQRFLEARQRERQATTEREGGTESGS